MILDKINFEEELNERGALLDLSLNLTERFKEERIIVDINELDFNDEDNDDDILNNISYCSDIDGVIVDKVYEEHDFEDDILEAFMECREIKIEKLYFEDSYLECEVYEEENNRFLFNKIEFTTSCKYAVVMQLVGNVECDEIEFYVNKVFVYDITKIDVDNEEDITEEY